MPLVCDALAPHSWHCFTHIRSSRASSTEEALSKIQSLFNRAGRTNTWWFPLNPPNLRLVNSNRTAARTHSSGLNRRSHVGRSNPQQASWKISHIHKDAGAAKPVISGVPYERAIRRIMDADVGTERDIIWTGAKPMRGRIHIQPSRC